MNLLRWGLRRLPWHLMVLGVVLIANAMLLKVYLVPITGGSDQNGYHVSARMFNLHGVFYQKPVDDLQFVGSMWSVNSRGEYYPKYPPLYPLLAAGMNRMLGPGGGFYATLWSAILAAAGMYVLARRLVGKWYAVLGAALVAFCPVFASLGIARNSHTPSIAFLIWGMAAVIHGTMMSRRKFLQWPLLFLGGFLVAYTTGIRYTDFLMIFVPISFVLLFSQGRRRWLRLIVLLLGAAIPFTVLALFHWRAYGAPWSTGYGLTEESSSFELKFAWTNFLIYLPDFFSYVVGPIGVVGLLGLRFRHRWRRTVFWSIWILPTFLLYLTYYWAPGGNGTGTMRFLMPIMPPAFLLILLVLRRQLRLLPDRNCRIIALVCLLVIQGIWGFTRITTFCEGKAANDLQNLVLLESMKNHIPEGMTVISTVGVLHEVDFEQRWRLYPSYLLTTWGIRNILERSFDVQSAGLQKIRAQALKDKLGDFSSTKLQEYLRDFFGELATSGHAVYFVGRGGEVNQFRRNFHRWFELETIATVTGERPPYLIRPAHPDSSRYRDFKKGKTPVKMPVWEIVRLGAKRPLIMEFADSETELQKERQEILDRVNRDNDVELTRDLVRLESIRDETIDLRRQAQQQKRVAEAKLQAEAKRKAEAEKKRQATEAKRLAELEKKKKQEAEAKRKAEAEKKRRQEAEVKRKVEAEAKRKAEAEKKLLAEEEAMRKADAEAKSRLATENRN